MHQRVEFGVSEFGESDGNGIELGVRRAILHRD
jgi:hypothetical protein